MILFNIIQAKFSLSIFNVTKYIFLIYTVIEDGEDNGRYEY